MADTLIDKVPPTVRAEPPRPRGRMLAVALAILTAVLLVAGVAFYLFVVRYDPLARRHIPGNAILVAHIDLADVALFGPVREHLLPLFEARRDEPGPSRIERIRAATGVNLETDLRELFVASADGSSFVAIFGGRIKRGRFIAGLAGLAHHEAFLAGFHEVGGLLLGPDGIAIGQADDGTILIGTDASIVTAALPATDDARALAPPVGPGSVTFVITKQAWSGAAGLAVVAHASVLQKIERAEGRFTLGRAPEVRMEMEPTAGNEAAALAGEIEQVLAEMRIVTLHAPDVAGEKGALQAVKVATSGAAEGAAGVTTGVAAGSAAGGGRVVLSAPWSYEALDRATARLGAALSLSWSAPASSGMAAPSTSVTPSTSASASASPSTSSLSRPSPSLRPLPSSTSSLARPSRSSPSAR